MRPDPVALAALVAALVTAGAAPRSARAQNPPQQPAARPAARPAPRRPLVPAQAPVPGEAPQEAELIRRIDAAATGAAPVAAQTITRIILRGPPPGVIARGLAALTALARPEGAPAIARYLHHRRPTIRRHAVAAARALHAPDLVDALANLLSDPDEAVRVDAAAALAEVGNRSVVARVLEAFERDLEDATGPQGGALTQPCALAIARYGGPDDVQRLAGFVGRAPLGALTAAMRPAMARPDLPETVRVTVIQAFGRLATRDVRLFLEGVVADAGNQDTAVARAARDAAARIAQ